MIFCETQTRKHASLPYSRFSQVFMPSILFVAIFTFCQVTLIGQGGYTLDFDGSSSYVEIPYSATLNPASTFTIECWAKVEGGTGTSRALIASTDTPGDGTYGYVLYAGSDNKWQFWTGRGFNCGSPTFSILNSNVTVSSAWTHIAGSYDGTTLKIYVNGVLANSLVDDYTRNTSRPLRIGAGATEGAANFFFPGKIDEVRIWSDERTVSEIQANMHKELAGSEANLLAYYNMSNGSGTSLTDNSTNSHTGTLNNTPAWKTSGALAGPDLALDFDGSNDHVTIPDDNALDLTNTFTIEAWVNPDVVSAGVYGRMLAKSNAFALGFNNSVIRFTTYNVKDYDLSYTIPTGTWTHIALSLDGNNDAIFYVNGINVGEITGTSPASTNTNPLILGTSTYSGVEDYDGKMDEIRIWSDVRTPAEIITFKDRALDGDEANLVAYYRFDQQANASNTTLFDYSGNAHNGTLTTMDPANDWITSNPFNTWIGSEDSDWSNTENWSLGSVPSTEDVGVYDWNGSNSPASTNISARNFYIAAGLSSSHTGDLTLSGNYYNDGTFTTTGVVTFSGSSAQTLQGSGTSTFGTLVINNAAGVTLEKDVTASTSLTLTNGLLNLNSQVLTLGNAGTVGGSPGNSNHVVATSGSLRKNYNATGNFLFPIGDGTAYSPISLNFTSASFSSGNASVSLTASKHPNNSSTSDFISRFWTVSSSGITSFSCNVSAVYDDGDINGTEGDIDGGKWDGASWTPLGSVTAGSNLITGTVSSFSDFTGGEPSVFPVEWLSFTANVQNDRVLLDWATASEINADLFVVERQIAQNKWSDLGEVKAVGNSSEVQNYIFEDRSPLIGTAYYRLRQVDQNGAFSYSNIIEVSFKEDVLLVYPNPVSDILTIHLPGKNRVAAKLIDMNGRVVLKTPLEVGQNTLSLGELPAGRYILKIRENVFSRQVFPIVKE